MNRWSKLLVPMALAAVATVFVLGPGRDSGDGRGAPLAGESLSSSPGEGQPAPATAAGQSCIVEAAGIELHGDLRETSGLARTADGALWTHNDGDEARLYRIDEGGAIGQVIELTGVAASDIEDIDAGPCPAGDGECLYLADTGDNDANRTEVALLAVSVPTRDAHSAAARIIPFRYEAGPRDAEALAVADGRALIVSKGRNEPIELFRLDPTATAGRSGPLLRAAAQLAPEPSSNRDRVTGAAASEDGAWIALRTNDALVIQRAASLGVPGAAPALAFDLRPLGERQGEGIELTNDGTVWLTSEGESGAPTLARLRCTLPE